MAWRSKPESGGAAAHDAIENVLGRSCTVRGDLSAEGAFRIDGTVEGSVESRAAVVVGESGVVRGGVRGTDVVVAGTVIGDVICSGHLEILAKGRIEGDISARSMRIETGGVFRGTSSMGDAVVTGESPESGAAEASGAVFRPPSAMALRPTPSTEAGVDLERIRKEQAKPRHARLRIMIAGDPNRPIRTISLPRRLPLVASVVVGTLALATVVLACGSWKLSDALTGLEGRMFAMVRAADSVALGPGDGGPERVGRHAPPGGGPVGRHAAAGRGRSAGSASSR